VDPPQYQGGSLKIVFNAVSAKLGGAVTYLTNVLRCLPPPKSGYEFDVFLPPEVAKIQLGLLPNVRLHPTSAGHEAWWKRVWWEQVTLRRWLIRQKASFLFSTANFGMFRCPVRQLLLVRIPQYFSRIYLDTLLPEHSFTTRVAFKLRRWLCCQSVRAADIVMTPTQAMLDDLRQFVKVDPRKALVNHYGVASEDSPPHSIQGTLPASFPPAQRVVRLIYVSLYSEHKNLRTLLKAMPFLNRDGTVKFLLRTTVDPAWAGAAWTLTHKDDLALARQPDVSPWVEFLGPLQLGQLEELYRQSDVFVFPSVCESFGHPMVEAMVHGLPIAAADTPVNRELCGEAALYFMPLDPEDLAEKVVALDRNRALREETRRTGRQRAAEHFRWQDHVARLLRVVESPASCELRSA
jgi:glycosyltransferase involved in cell wall biosynthesis